jgi:hypothetical protein
VIPLASDHGAIEPSPLHRPSALLSKLAPGIDAERAGEGREPDFLFWRATETDEDSLKTNVNIQGMVPNFRYLRSAIID